MRPSVIVFDVNETLADLSPLAARFVEVGAPASMAGLWFASLLRDGFALTVAGESKPFADIAVALLRGMLPEAQLNRSVDDAVAIVMDGMTHLEPHADVASGVRGLAEQGLRLVTLGNGAAVMAEQLLAGADLREEFEHVLSVDDAGVWKPDARAYAYAAKVCGVEPGEMLLAAVHPWDVHGAARAGLQTAWVNRTASPYPAVFAAPDHTVTGVEELSDVLASPAL
jgi:2-haloacid dehalogenase